MFFAENLLKQVCELRELHRPRSCRQNLTGAPPPPIQWRRRGALTGTTSLFFPRPWLVLKCS